jgi:hypothetical protein
MSRPGAPDNGALARGEHGRWQLDCSRLQGRLDTAIRPPCSGYMKKWRNQLKGTAPSSPFA